MLTLTDFINKYTGVLCGDTQENFGQCVGLIELWTDNLGLPHTWGNAKDLIANADRTKFDVIFNSPFNWPQAGDVLIFGATWGGGYGHTGVVVSANILNFRLFEQNNPVGHAPQILTHSYSGVVGWLHPKAQIDPVDQLLSEIKTNINSPMTDDEFKNYLSGLDKSLMRNALRKGLGI